MSIRYLADFVHESLQVGVVCLARPPLPIRRLSDRLIQSRGGDFSWPPLGTFNLAMDTRDIALTLNASDQITVQGYLHPVRDASSNRLPSFWIGHLLYYPGKRVKGAEGGD